MGLTRQHSQLFLLPALFTLCAGVGFQFQPTFLQPAYDQFGNEVSRDRVLEIMDMKSTLLGFGLGFSYFGARPSSQPGRRSAFPQTPIIKGSPLPAASTRGPAVRVQPTSHVTLTGHPAYSPEAFRPVSTALYTGYHRVPGRSSVSDDINQEIVEHLSRIPLSFDPSSSHRLGGSESFFDFPAFFPSGRRAPSGLGRRGCSPRQQIRCNAQSRYRTIDGVCNNLRQPRWGAVMQPFRRLHDFNYYYDGWNIPRLTSTVNHARLLPSARLVSRSIHEPDSEGKGQELTSLTNLIQVWGQFLDHDITGTPAHKDQKGDELKCCRNTYLTKQGQIHPDALIGGPCHPIYVPPRDRHFSEACMNFARSQPVMRKRDCDKSAPREVRNQMNMLTSYIDASQVYGSSLKENQAIRLYRYGMLRVTPLDLLPEDVNVTCVKDQPGDYCFKAGEMRVNEHPALSSVHTVFHRLHNQMAIALTRLNPRWDDETIFQEVRKIMSAVFQFITYHEWLPIVLGSQVMKEYGLPVRGIRDGPSSHHSYWYYDRSLDASVINAFATAAFRFGHTLIPSRFSVGYEKIPLHFMFNRPNYVLRDGGRSVSKFCSGMQHDKLRRFDRFITTELSDHLFEDKRNISLDLASLNIQRGRDHGLPTYNDYRQICGLPRIKSFNQWAHTEPGRAKVFRRVYDHVDDIDLFSGGISEKSLPGAIVGHTFACIIATQMRNVKYGDRFWFESDDSALAFTPAQIREIRSFSLSRVLCTMAPLRQTLVNPFYASGSYLPEPVMLATGEVVVRNRYVACDHMKSLDMKAWYDPKSAI